MKMWERTLTELNAATKETYIAKMKTVAFLKQYRWENLTSAQMLKILEILKEETK